MKQGNQKTKHGKEEGKKKENKKTQKKRSRCELGTFLVGKITYYPRGFLFLILKFLIKNLVLKMLLMPYHQNETSQMYKRKKNPNCFWLKKCENLLKKKSLLPMKEGRRELRA